MLAALLAAIGMYLLTDTVGQALVENIYMSESAQNQGFDATPEKSAMPNTIESAVPATRAIR